MTVSTSSAVSTSQPERTQTLEFKAFRPRIGAVVSGLDLAQSVDAGTRAQLQQALLKYGVLFFRDQQFGPERFIEVASLFGEPHKQNKYSYPLEGFPEIELLENSPTRDQKADIWHADVVWQKNPPKATILHAQLLPSEGGDTLWSSTAGAYDLLDPKFAAYLETLTAVNTFELSKLKENLLGTYYGRFPAEGGEERLAEARASYPPIEIPVIATHPETGRKVINVTAGHTSHIKDVSRTISNNLLNILFDLVKSPELQARFHWKPGSVAVWDNRQIQHYGVNDYGQELRRFHRLTIRDAVLS